MIVEKWNKSLLLFLNTVKRKCQKGYFTFLVARKRVLCYWFIRFEFRFMSHASVRCKLSPISSAIRSRIWGGFCTVQWAIFYTFILPNSIQWQILCFKSFSYRYTFQHWLNIRICVVNLKWKALIFLDGKGESEGEQCCFFNFQRFMKFHKMWNLKYFACFKIFNLINVGPLIRP